MTLDEIEALTPEKIATLSLDRIKDLIVEVQIVDWPHEPSESELAGIIDRVRVVLHALHGEHLTRARRLCGGLPEPYVRVRLPGAPGV